MNKKEKILITGGFGFIGSAFCKFLIKKNYDIFIIDDFSNSRKINFSKKVKCLNISLSKTSIVSKFIKKNKITTIFHFAAKIYAQESIKNPKKYFRNNHQYTENLLKIAIEHNVKNFIFSSTAAIYGKKKKIFRENDNKNPINPYGRSKLMAENSIIKNKKKINFAILRFFNIAGANIKNKYGPVKNKYSVITKLIISVLKKKIFYINGANHNTKDGSPVRDFIHIDDIIKIIFKSFLKIKTSKKSIIINCGSGDSISVIEIIDILSKILNRKVNFSFKQKLRNDPSEVIADVKLQNKILNFKNKKKIENIINSSYEWQKYINKRKLV